MVEVATGTLHVCPADVQGEGVNADHCGQPPYDTGTGVFIPTGETAIGFWTGQIGHQGRAVHG